MSVLEEHVVPASLAAMIHQLDIALGWLSEGAIQSRVGIETLDDVSRVDDRDVTLGQSKISLSRNPLTDRSPNLWNTLKIWLDAIDADDVDLEHTRFLLLSNFEIKTGLMLQLKQAAADEKKLRVFVTRLREVGSEIVDVECRPHATAVLSRSDASLLAFFLRITVAGGQPLAPLAQLPLLQAKLQLTEDIASAVIQGLRGWLQEKVQESLARKEPAWIERSLFIEQLHDLVERHRNRRLNLRGAQEFVITETQRLQHKSARFVQQLGWIGIGEDDEQILDAINDFLMSASERTRLSVETNITRSQFESFEKRLVDRWKPLHHLAKRSTERPEDAGHTVYCKIQDHREPLAGHETGEFYFTRGTYHSLANGSDTKQPVIGWHPNFEGLL